jgi:hypothetical protein
MWTPRQWVYGTTIDGRLKLFRLIKSAGQEMKSWQQTDVMSILRLLLVGSMACVCVSRLMADDNQQTPRKAII